MKAPRPRRVVALVAASIALAGFATTAFAQSPQSAGKKYVATKEIIFDKATKSLRKPTEKETEAMVATLATLTDRSVEGLTPRKTATGATQVKLEGRFGGVLLGRANADGTTELRCVTTMADAAEFLGLEEVAK